MQADRIAIPVRRMSTPGSVPSAMAAEIGTMRVTEQIDALESLGRSPMSHLIIPRVFAATLMLPALVIFADLIGIGAGWFGAKEGDAADDKERDASHRKYVAHRHYRMSQLVQQDAHKQHNGCHPAHDPILDRGPVLKFGWVVADRHCPGEQHKNQKPGVVQSDGDAQNAS